MKPKLYMHVLNKRICKSVIEIPKIILDNYFELQQYYLYSLPILYYIIKNIFYTLYNRKKCECTNILL